MRRYLGLESDLFLCCGQAVTWVNALEYFHLPYCSLSGTQEPPVPPGSLGGDGNGKTLVLYPSMSVSLLPLSQGYWTCFSLKTWGDEMCSGQPCSPNTCRLPGYNHCMNVG